MKTAILALLWLLVVPGAWAEEAKAPPKLEELEALTIERVVLERKVLEERSQKLQQEARAIQAEVRALEAEYQARARELDGLVEAAAKRAGVDPKRFRPDVGTKTWRPIKVE
ncbi:MAG TPA: hypothetical protein DCQ64_06300 [Candidatus Rokubacteria bacterium]|nr:hypothetical protein [Candidatus Rokubacteria bacterium]